MARQAARCCVSILVICFPLFQCYPIDGVTNVPNDAIHDQFADDELDDFFFDEDYETHDAISRNTTPMPATTSFISSWKNVVMEPSKTTTSGRSTSPIGRIPISKGTKSTTKPSIAREKAAQSQLSTASKVLPTTTNETDEIEFDQDYSSEYSEHFGLYKANGEQDKKLTTPTQTGLSKLVAQPVKTTKSDKKVNSKSSNTDRETASKNFSYPTNGMATFQERLTMTNLTTTHGHKDKLSGSEGNPLPLRQVPSEQANILEAPTTTFSPLINAEITTANTAAQQNPTSNPLIEVKQSTAATFQQAQQPSITVSPVPQISVGQQVVNFAGPATQPMPSPTFTQTSTFIRPAANFPLLPPWSASPPIQTVPFSVSQPPFATATFNQPMRQEDGGQLTFSNVPQHPIPAHAAFQHSSHAASEQQQMAMGAGQVAQQVASQPVSPSSVANSQPVYTTVGQPIWIRTKAGLSQVNLLPVSMLPHFVPTFKSTGIQIVPPMLIKANSG